MLSGCQCLPIIMNNKGGVRGELILFNFQIQIIIVFFNGKAVVTVVTRPQGKRE